MNTHPYCAPVSLMEQIIAACDRRSASRTPQALYLARTSYVVVQQNHLPRQTVVRPPASLEARVAVPTWARDERTRHLWRQSLKYPDVLFALPTRFKCHLCKCEGSRKRRETGLEECAWCAGEGRDISRHASSPVAGGFWSARHARRW